MKLSTDRTGVELMDPSCMLCSSLGLTQLELARANRSTCEPISKETRNKHSNQHLNPDVHTITIH